MGRITVVLNRFPTGRIWQTILPYFVLLGLDHPVGCELGHLQARIRLGQERIDRIRLALQNSYHRGWCVVSCRHRAAGSFNGSDSSSGRARYNYVDRDCEFFRSTSKELDAISDLPRVDTARVAELFESDGA